MRTYAIVNLLILLAVVEVHSQDTTLQMVSYSYELTDSSFNKGNIYNPLHLIQGRNPGVLISRAGSDPNLNYSIRVRGITTLYGRTTPLILVDDVPVLSLEQIDPNDISQIDILSGPETALYGIQGASGVIRVKTKTGSRKPFELSYRTYYSLEEKIYKQQSFSPEEFIAIGGNDVGARTNWTEEISQVASGFAHNISAGGTINSFTYRGALNFRDQNGIQRNTGFKRINGRFNAKFSALNEKMLIKYRGSYTSENASLGFPEAFKYALIANPTLPIRFEETGDYVESYNFDDFNPVAMINLNERIRTRNISSHSIYGNYDFGFANFRLIFNRNSYDQHLDENYDEDAVYRKGEDFENHQLNVSHFYNAQLDTKFKVNNYTISGAIGGEYQKYFSSENEFFSYSYVYNAGSITRNERSIFNIPSIFLNANLSYKNLLSFLLTDRIDKSTALPHGNQWTNFYSISGRLNLLNYFPVAESWFFKIGYGKSGLTPYNSNISKNIFSSIDDPQYLIQSANPELRGESVKNFEISSSFVSIDKRFHASATKFYKTAKDIIQIKNNYDNDLSEQFVNSGKLLNKGWEVSFAYDIIKSSKLSYTSSLQFSYLKTKWKELLEDSLEISYPGGPGVGNEKLQVYIKGQPFGTFYGPFAHGFDDRGYPIYKEINNDGHFNRYLDQQIIGEALPKYFISWDNNFRYGNIILNLFFRSAIGHDIANMNRRFYGGPLTYTLVNNFLKNDIRTTGYYDWSNLFVENASYLKLDYIELAYNFKIRTKFLSHFQIFGVVNNVFTITKYKGNDPEVRLTDIGYQWLGSRLEPSNLSTGIDRPIGWLPSKTYSIGFRIN